MIERGQIVLCNLTLQDNKGKKIELKKVLFSFPYDRDRMYLHYSDFEDRRLIHKAKKKEDLRVLKIEVLKELGYKSNTKKYTEVKKNEEKRNNITGAYE